MMTEDYNESQLISRKMRLIANIRPQQKIDTVKMEIINTNTATNFWRGVWTLSGYKGYSRDDLYNLIEELSNRAYNIIQKYHTSENGYDKNVCQNLRKQVDEMCSNISNIRETYITDQAFCVKLDSLHDSICSKFDSMSDNQESLLLKKVLSSEPMDIPIKDIPNTLHKKEYNFGETPSTIDSVEKDTNEEDTNDVIKDTNEDTNDVIKDTNEEIKDSPHDTSSDTSDDLGKYLGPLNNKKKNKKKK